MKEIKVNPKRIRKDVGNKDLIVKTKNGWWRPQESAFSPQGIYEDKKIFIDDEFFKIA